MKWIQTSLDKVGITAEIGPPRYMDNLGHLYRVLGIGGIKEEGAPMPLFAVTRELAMNYYIKDLLELLQTDRHIVWRTEPEVEQLKIPFARNPPELWYVYSRLTTYPTIEKLQTMICRPEGPLSAQIMIVGEAPGHEEDRLGLPFQGESGKELNRMLADAGIARSECFLTNVVRSRPPNNDLNNFIAKAKRTVQMPTRNSKVDTCFLWCEQAMICSNVRSRWSSLKSSLHLAIRVYGHLREFRGSPNGAVQCSIRMESIGPKSSPPTTLRPSFANGPGAPLPSKTLDEQLDSAEAANTQSRPGGLWSDQLLHAQETPQALWERLER